MVRSLLDRIASGEITEDESHDIHEKMMGDFEMQNLLEHTRRIAYNHSQTCYSTEPTTISSPKTRKDE